MVQGSKFLQSYDLTVLRSYGLLLLLLMVSFKGISQVQQTDSKGRLVVPEGYMLAKVDGKDTTLIVYLPEIFIFPELKFKNEKEKQEYTKLVRDVKRALPYAKLIYNTLIETYEYIETMPNKKEKEAHLKRMEKELYQQYKPELKKLTLTQGKLLIKLVDRECNQTSYNIVSAYLGGVRASFWNIFAGMFGASLKSKYDPNGKDAMTERVVILVEQGQI